MVATYKITHNLLGCLSCKTLAKLEIILSVFWCTDDYEEIRLVMAFQPLSLVPSKCDKYYKTKLVL